MPGMGLPDCRHTHVPTLLPRIHGTSVTINLTSESLEFCDHCEN